MCFSFSTKFKQTDSSHFFNHLFFQTTTSMQLRNSCPLLHLMWHFLSWLYAIFPVYNSLWSFYHLLQCMFRHSLALVFHSILNFLFNWINLISIVITLFCYILCILIDAITMWSFMLCDIYYNQLLLIHSLGF